MNIQYLLEKKKTKLDSVFIYILCMNSVWFIPTFIQEEICTVLSKVTTYITAEAGRYPECLFATLPPCNFINTFVLCLYVKSPSISINPLFLIFFFRLGLSQRFLSCMYLFYAYCWQWEAKSWPKFRYFTVHMEAHFADLGWNSGPAEINGKTSVGQNFTPEN